MHEDFQSKSPTPPPMPEASPYVPAMVHPSPQMASSGVSEEDKSMAMLCHLLAIFTGFVGPLVIWLVKKDQSAFIAHHGREALNFQITMLLVMLCVGSVTMVLMLVLIGIFLVPVLFAIPIIGIVLEAIAAVSAQRGEWHRYPCCLRLV